MLSIIHILLIVVTAFFLLLLFFQFRKSGPKFLYIIPEQNAMVIERLGKFNRVIKSGPHLAIPFFEKPKKIYWRYSYNPYTGEPTPLNEIMEYIDLRETEYNFPQQTVITKDNAQMLIDVFIIVKIRDPHSIVYVIENFPSTIQNLVEASLRNIIGAMELDLTLTSRKHVNEKLREHLKERTKVWGVTITNVEIKNIVPDEKILEAMKLQTIYERRKRAQIEIGEAEKEMLIAVKEALEGDGAEASKYLATVRYVNAFKKLVTQKDGKVVFVPYEGHNLLGSLGFLKEFFKEKDTDIRSRD